MPSGIGLAVAAVLLGGFALVDLGHARIGPAVLQLTVAAALLWCVLLY